MMMKSLAGALLLLCFLPTAAQTPRDSVALATATWHATDLGNGAECRRTQVELFGSHQCISVVAYPRRGFSTRIVQLDGKGAATSRIGTSAGAVAAVNGSYFNMKTFRPITFVLVDKHILGHTTPGELKLRTNGVLAVRGKRGRRIAIFPCDTTAYPRVARRYRSALAAGPVLVTDGQIVRYDAEDDFHTRRHPRTLIGTRPDGTVLMVVIDGRFAGRAEGATIAETAYIARQLGLTDALNLDGGGSSTLWTAQEGVLNHPSDNRRFDHAGERAVPNAVAVLRK